MHAFSEERPKAILNILLTQAQGMRKQGGVMGEPGGGVEGTLLSSCGYTTRKTGCGIYLRKSFLPAKVVHGYEITKRNDWVSFIREP